MEKKAIRIVSQQALVERDWTNQQGENITIATKELEFSDGIDSFVAEATDHTVVNLQVTMSIRSWKSKDTGRENRANSIRIQKIAVV